jgi:TAG lipase/steryl ester hydrolase/phospholipase A2/LPA acyltransferase
VLEAESLGLGRRQTNVDDLAVLFEQIIPDLTFQEAYEKTGREINVTIAPLERHQTSRLMNAITSPNVFIRSAVLASCAVPGVFPPVTLQAKNVYGERQPYLPKSQWVDGAITDDLPAKRLARLYGVNHTIVSQANPLALLRMRGERWWRAPQGVKNVFRTAEREYLKAAEAYARRYLRRIPGIGRAANLAYRVNSQEYTGDINIVADLGFIDPRKLLGVLDQHEIDQLVGLGERAAWTQLDRIRICTEISRTLENILDHHNDHDVRKFYKTRNAGKRPRRSELA